MVTVILVCISYGNPEGSGLCPSHGPLLSADEYRKRSQVSAEGSTYSFSFRELVKATDLALS